MNSRKKYYGVLLFFILLIYSCTDSPFGSDKISPRNRTLSGKVILSDSLSPDGVYVWLEGLEIGTYTNANGEFLTTLSNPQLQSEPGGLTGAFRLYFYMANYNLAAVNVALKQGEFVYSVGSWDKNGKLKTPLKLEKFLAINIKTSPNSASLTESQQIAVDITMRAMKYPVTVLFPAKAQGIAFPLILERRQSDQFYAFETGPGDPGMQNVVEVQQEPFTKRIMLDLKRGHQMQPGNYKVIPYMFILGQSVPEKLVASFGDIQDIENGYLKRPIRIEDGSLLITE